MNIDPNILITWGGVAKKYRKGEYVFAEGELPRFYFQILKGAVKVFNSNFDGKEFTQAEFSEGESFGEPPLIIHEAYPSNCLATEESVIIRLTKDKFDDILREYPDLQKRLMESLAQRIYAKTVTATNLINNCPESRIKLFLENYKKKQSVSFMSQVEIPYTRQEIANFTGLRVETVIRTLSKMSSKNIVKIINRKLFA